MKTIHFPHIIKNYSIISISHKLLMEIEQHCSPYKFILISGFYSSKHDFNCILWYVSIQAQYLGNTTLNLYVILSNISLTNYSEILYSPPWWLNQQCVFQSCLALESVEKICFIIFLHLWPDPVLFFG